MLVFSIFWWYLEETELKRSVFSTTNISFVVEVSEFPLEFVTSTARETINATTIQDLGFH